MDAQEVAEINELRYTELKKEVENINRILEGDGSEGDWLKNSRMQVFYMDTPEKRKFPSSGNYFSKNFETSGGMLYGVAVVHGDASNNAQMLCRVRLDGQTIAPTYSASNLNDVFQQTFLLCEPITPGKHTVTMIAQCQAGSAYSRQRGTRIVFCVPGKKY